MASTTVVIERNTSTVDVSPLMFYTVHTFALAGAIDVASGETNYIPPFFFFKRATQTSKIIKCVHTIHAGTQATVRLKQNGSVISDFSSVNVTTTQTTSSTSGVALSDGDILALEVTAITGSPQNLTFTIVVEHTVV